MSEATSLLKDSGIAEHEAKQAGEGPYGQYIQGGGVPEDAVQIPAKAGEGS
jgi:essential nuclear protein 1